MLLLSPPLPSPFEPIWKQKTKKCSTSWFCKKSCKEQFVVMQVYSEVSYPGLSGACSQVWMQRTAVWGPNPIQLSSIKAAVPMGHGLCRGCIDAGKLDWTLSSQCCITLTRKSATLNIEQVQGRNLPLDQVAWLFLLYVHWVLRQQSGLDCALKYYQCLHPL